MTAPPPPAPPSVDPPGSTSPWPPPTPDSPVRPTLRRSRDEKMVGGVAGGLAEYSGIDPLLWRVGFVALTLAGVLISVGLLVLVARLTDWAPGPRPFLGVALLVVGLGLVASAFTPGRTGRGGLVVLGVVLSLALLFASSVPWTAGAGVGDRDYRPASVADVRDRYELGAGDLTVDLSRIDVADIDEPLHVAVDQGIGDMTVILPREADVRLELDNRVGDTQVFGGGSSDGGYFPGTGSGDGVDDGRPEFVVTIDHGVGDTEVSRG